MIPIRDDAPRSSYPYFTLGLVIVNVCIFVHQFALYLSSSAEGDAFVLSFGAISANVNSALIGRYPSTMASCRSFRQCSCMAAGCI